MVELSSEGQEKFVLTELGVNILMFFVDVPQNAILNPKSLGEI